MMGGISKATRENRKLLQAAQIVGVETIGELGPAPCVDDVSAIDRVVRVELLLRCRGSGGRGRSPGISWLGAFLGGLEWRIGLRKMNAAAQKEALLRLASAYIITIHRRMQPHPQKVVRNPASARRRRGSQFCICISLQRDEPI